MQKKLSLLLALSLPQLGFSFGELGHQTVAEIALRYLTPAAQQSVVNIIGLEAMADAATWPDLVRSDKDFDPFKPYHYVTVATGKKYGEISPEERESKDAFTIVSKYPKLIVSKTVDRSTKIAALKYLLHAVGDLHQPFHVGNIYDRGANLCLVKIFSGPKVTNLHSVWDGFIVNASADRMNEKSKIPFYSYKNYATDLLVKYPIKPQDVKLFQNAHVFTWIDESQDLRTAIYPDDAPVKHDTERVYCGNVNTPDRRVDDADAKLLSEDYKLRSMELVERRILVAGIRLAGLLNKMFPSVLEAGPNKNISKKELIQNLLLKN